MRALDLFAGAGGWDIAARELGIECDGVEIMPEAYSTRYKNGLKTPWSDVWDLAKGLEDCNGFWGAYDGLIASPPCQTFSMAGKGAGRKALDDVLAIIESHGWENVSWLRRMVDTGLDERTALVLTPLLFWHHMRPTWVAFEQVSTVLPVWEAMADVMRKAGYSVWTGNLHAEQYGVPQTRKRAILMAKRGVDLPDSLSPPTPTHSKYYPRDKTRLDPGVKPWVSMAEALGWAGEKGVELHGSNRPNRAVRGEDQPASTLHWSERMNAVTWQDRQLGQGRLERHGKPNDRTTDEPSYSMRGQASGSAPGGGYVLTPGPVHANEGDETPLDWTGESPSPSMIGTFRPDVVAKRGYRKPGDPPRQKTPRSVRVTVEEAAILQGFPRDFVFCGGKGKQYLQVGNAIPPPLAKAILQSVTLSGKMNA